MTIGIIAEDQSDVDVVVALAAKLVDRRKFAPKTYLGNGCGKLRRKCGSWAMDFSRKDGRYMVAVHDLDEYNENELRTFLMTAMKPAGLHVRAVVIPKRTIEAWLLYDPSALKEVFGLRKAPKVGGDPEQFTKPESQLKRIARSNGRTYHNVIDNKKIAAKLDICRLVSSASFAHIPKFLRDCGLLK